MRRVARRRPALCAPLPAVVSRHALLPWRPPASTCPGASARRRLRRLLQAGPSSVAASKYFYGVGWLKRYKRWRGQFRHNGRTVNLPGTFDTAIAAAKAVDAWLRENGRAADANFNESGIYVPRVSTKSSRYRGVSWNKSKNQWQAIIGFAGEKENLGYFDDEVEAARAYDTRAAELDRPTKLDLSGVSVCAA